MERAQPGRNSDVEKVRREKIRDGESQKREDAGARKGRKVAKRNLKIQTVSTGSRGLGNGNKGDQALGRRTGHAKF